MKKLIAIALIPLTLTACVTTGAGYGYGQPQGGYGQPQGGYYPPQSNGIPPHAQGNAYGHQRGYQQPGYAQHYGTVVNVQETMLQNSDNVDLAGALIGGVAGLGAGSLVGKGKGNTAAKVIGAVGGAYAGNEVAKNMKNGTVGLVITVQMDDGTRVQAVQPREAGYFQRNDRVRVIYDQQGRAQVTY